MPDESSATKPLLKSEVQELEDRQTPLTLLAVPVDIPPFKEGTDFDDWLFFTKAELELYEPARRVSLLLRALPYDLRREAMDAGVTLSSDIEECCEVLVKLTSLQKEEFLASDFFHRLQKPGEGDEDFAANLQSLAKQAFKDCCPLRVASWIAAQFKRGLRPPVLAEQMVQMRTSRLSRLIDAALAKRQELQLSTEFEARIRPWSLERRPPTGGQRRALRSGSSTQSKTQSSLFCQLPSRCSTFVYVRGKLEGQTCSFRLDSGVVRSLLNPQAFPMVCSKANIIPPATRLRSAEGKEISVMGEAPITVSIGNHSWEVNFVLCSELAWDVLLGADFLRQSRAVMEEHKLYRSFLEEFKAYCKE